MTRYVALLRGINVAGHRKVPMKELRAACEALGFEDVRTYVASGNVVFEATRGEHGEAMSAAIADTFGHDDVPVLVFDAKALHAIAAANPYDTKDADPKKAYVGFLASKPQKTAVEKLEAYERGDADLHVGGDAIYVRYPDGLGRAKLTHAVIERVLAVDVTMRNLRTVRTLVEWTS